jgi:S1-C subfamily serine protease
VRGTGLAKGDATLAFADCEYSTGLIQSDGLVLTTKHSVVFGGRTSQDVQILTFNSSTYIPAKVLLVSTDHDIAVLWSPGVGTGRLAMSRRKPREGDGVLVSGYPSFRYPFSRLVVSRGVVVNPALDEEVTEARRERRGLLAVDAPVMGGHSGSPVLDQGLQVIGVITSAFETNDGRWDGRSFFISAEDLARIISAAKERLGVSGKSGRTQ